MRRTSAGIPFFIDAAGDGTVPPSILPGSKKLGDERVFVNTEILQAEGPAGEDYRKRKLLEHYLEPVALKGDLKVMDVRLLLCLCESTNGTADGNWRISPESPGRI